MPSFIVTLIFFLKWIQTAFYLRHITPIVLFFIQIGWAGNLERTLLWRLAENSGIFNNGLQGRSTKHILIQIVSFAVSCGFDTCFTVLACDGLYHLTKSMYRIGTRFGFQSIIWTCVWHTVSMCLIFPALPEVAKVKWANWTNSKHKSKFLTYGSIWVVLLLLFFRSSPSTFPL